MAKKPMVMEKPLPQQIAKARKEGRTQQALDLTRQLYKQNQNEENRELLRQVTLERARQLQAQGKLKDAATVFTNLLTMGGAAALIAEAAQQLAACGAPEQALAALAQIADPLERNKVLSLAADAALAQGPAGKNALPVELHTGFDQIVQAFAHYEAGRDEDARAALQSIGLQSPFLEWKLLLRGLIAYQAKDDVRAIENWQRLDPHRLPSRLAGPLRAAIDPAFLRAQPAAVQQALKTKLMQQQGIGVAAPLRELRDLLTKNNLAPAFRKAETIVAPLRQEHPDLARRLAQCFFWSIIERGQPEDVERHARVFGATADDPHRHRLEALALEARGMWPEAHAAWQDFIKDVAANPGIWPAGAAARVQALIWSRMAENAHPHMQKRSASGNPFFDMFARQTKPLKPSAEACFQKAIELAPDRLDAYRDLLHLYLDEDKIAKAKKIGAELIKRFPDHADTLEILGELCIQTKAYNKAEKYFEKAIEANPLDRMLRDKLRRARQNLALKYVCDDQFVKARKQLERTLQLCDNPGLTVRCLWAVAEVKANDPARAQELIAQALVEPAHRLAVRYGLVVAAARVDLPAQEKKQLTDDLKAALAQPATPLEVLLLLEIAAYDRSVYGDGFPGQKTHEKTILKFFEKVDLNGFDEPQLVQNCANLGALQARKAWLKCLTHARRKHPKNVFIRLSFVDYYLMDESRDPKTHLAREHLDAARGLVEALPRGEVQQQYLERIQMMEELITELESRRPTIFDMMGHVFGDYGPVFDDDEDDDFW